MNQFLVFIFGATASNKSALAHSLAKEVGGLIVNADSRQLYREIPILTACPNSEKMKEVPHALYGVLEAQETPNVLWWTKEVKKLIKRGESLIIVGGCGLYLNTLLEGISPIPDISSDHREACRDLCEKHGVDFLVHELSKQGVPPAFSDKSRVLRAYEVFTYTQKPIEWWQNQPKVGGIAKDVTFSDIPRFMFCPMWNRHVLYHRAEARCHAMIKNGLMDEIGKIKDKSMSKTFRSSIGMEVLIDLYQGRIELEQGMESFKKQVRHYIKRQLTWLHNKVSCNYTPVFPQYMVSFSSVVQRRLEAVC